MLRREFTCTCINLQPLFTHSTFGLPRLMPAALQLRLRASCLKWRPHEVQQARTVTRFSKTRRPSFLKARKEQENVEALSEKHQQRQQNPLNHTPSIQQTSKPPTLLEELFPEEAQRINGRPGSGRERDIPRLDVRSTVPETPVQEKEKRDSWWDDADTEQAPSNWWNSRKSKSKPASPKVDKAKQKVMGVLMLRNASRSLIEDDFTRLIPQGLHIEGWPLDQADIIKVVPGRDTSTLERLNWYLILFNSRESMNAYRTHVQRLHSLAGKHVQSSLTSPIAPPPGYLMQGQDVDALLQSYTLIPSTQRLQLLPLPDEKAPSLAVMVKYRGYPDIVNVPLQEPIKVILRFDGPQLSLHVIKRMMIRVERERRVPWDQDFGLLNYAVWHPKGKNISPLDPRSTLEEEEEFDKEKKGRTERKERVQGVNEEAKKPRRKHKASYIVGFHNEDKAQAFVRYWHRRSVELENFTYENDDVAPVLEAEVLW